VNAATLVGMDGFAELAVLRFVSEGLPNKQVATALSIAGRTVKSHIASAMNKLGVDNRAHAAVAGIQRGLLQPHETCGFGAAERLLGGRSTIRSAAHLTRCSSQAILAFWTASLRGPVSERPPARADSDDAGASPS
jgi:DNA-binding CsgD family transcriptional regulator